MELAGFEMEAVRVPVVVTGEFVIVKKDGIERPTELTEAFVVLQVAQANAPETPPIKDPNVPEYVIGEVTVGVLVEVVYTSPVEPTLTVPWESAGSRNGPLKVEEAGLKRPLTKLVTVEVDMP